MGIELHHLYRAMDFVADHKVAIEEQLYWRVADLLSMDVDLIFYDTTSIYFEVDQEDEGLRRRGYSKDRRHHRTHGHHPDPMESHRSETR